MMKPKGLQIIISGDKKKYCRNCNTDITDINNTTYLKQRWGSPKFWDELCECDNCQNKYLLRHELFDRQGHINLFVFTEDINDPGYHWVDNLNDEQKIVIKKHLSQCAKCRKKVDDQECADVELKSIFNKIREKR